MLYLNPPFPVIDGVSFLPDHLNPLVWYFQPVAPHLATVTGGDGAPIPQLSLVEYRGQAGTGGFLNIDVDCGIDQERIDDLAGQLKTMMRLDGRPILSPVPLTNGTVKLSLFDLETGAPAPSGGGIRFVDRITHDANPALYGRNQAAFSVQLTQAGVTALRKALEGEMSPIGIVYSLEFLALRPAYSVSLKIDWHRVQKHLDEQFGIDSIFTSVQIGKTVDELFDDRVIEFTVDTFVPEDKENASVISRRDQAAAEVMDMITQAFFEPSLNPVTEAEDGWDKVEHLAKTASALAVTGGWAALGSFTYKNVDLTRVDSKTLDVNMSERTTVKRSIYPQGHLSGLLRPIRDAGLDLDRFIMRVDLDDPWFQRRRLKLLPRVNWDGDGVESVDVHLTYPGQPPQNVIFDKDTAPAEVEWPSKIVDDAMVAGVDLTYTVRFADVDATERPRELTSAARTVDVEAVEIVARDLYSVTPIAIRSLGVPWDRYPRVEVHLRHQDDPSGIDIDDVVVLTETAPDTIYNLFTLSADPVWEHQITYRSVDHKDVVLPWTTGDSDISVPNPFPSSKRRTVEFVPTFDPAAVSRAFVDAVYEDAANDVLVEQSLMFKGEDTDPKGFAADIADPTVRTVRYSVTIVFRDGRITEIPPSSTRERRVIVNERMTGHQSVTIRPEAVPFAERGVRQVAIDVRYTDEAEGVSFADQLVFDAADDIGVFEFDYVNPSRTGIDHRCTTTFTNNMVVTSDWAPAPSSEDLVIPIGTKS